MSKLVEFAQRFRRFLGFAALVLLIGLAATTYLFSQGSFDQVLGGFSRLSSTQFVTIVYAVLGGLFVIVMTLIALAFVRTGTGPGRRGGVLFVYVHEDKTPTRGIAGTAVTLLLPEPKADTTDGTGTTKFVFGAEHVGREFLCGVRHTGYLEQSKKVTLKDGSRIMIGLKPDGVQLCETDILRVLDAKGGPMRRSALGKSAGGSADDVEAALQNLLRRDAIRMTASADPMIHKTTAPTANPQSGQR